MDRPSLADVEAWYERLQQHCAYQEQVMIPLDELRGRLDHQWPVDEHPSHAASAWCAAQECVDQIRGVRRAVAD